MPLSRTVRAARTCGVGSAGPTPPLWDITRNICSPRICSSVSRVSLPCPTCVVIPYTASLRARERSTTSLLAAITSRALLASSTLAPSTMASRSSRASGSSVIVTTVMGRLPVA